MKLLRRLLKIVGVLVLLALVLGASFVIHVWYFKPVTINLFFAREALQFALESPEMLSSVRVLEKFGIDGHNAELNDASMASGDRMFKRLENAHATLASYADTDLDPADLRSKQILMSLLGLGLEAKEFRFHNYPVNQLFGVQNGFPTFMESTHQIHNEGDAEDYVTRLSKVGIKFDQVLDGLGHREAQGILPPQFVIDRVLEEMRNFIATPATDGILMKSLVTKMDEANLEEGVQQRIAQAAKAEIEDTVYPAYQRLIDYFDQLDPKVSENNGVWALPNGEKLYQLAIRFFTTTAMDAEEIHQIGLAEVDRIQSEMLEILAAEGWDVSPGFESVMALVAADPQFYYSDTGEGRQQILDDYQAIIDEISGDLDQAFGVKPQAPVEVKRIPQFKEKTSPGAYYNAPAMDGSRPGIFYANLYDIKATPRYGMRTLAYHEAVPGHHLQIAIQRELEDMPFFRRMIPFTAYSEGWALYSERLAYEMGFLEDPLDNLGRLQAELFRAVRLVVDTGIHHKRWTREQAINYMVANTAMAQSDVVSEIERYFVMPGQALAYKVGMMKILELREKARSALGSQFNLPDFHDVILTNGAMPLTMLEDVVDEYIAQRQTG